MTMNRSTILILGALGLTAIYLFVSAPPPLPEEGPASGVRIPVERVFRMLSADNNRHRGLYTSAVVGPGLKTGLKFDEQWEEESVEAGPLPALFLRATARELERTGVQVGLFLGSDFPIESSNRFNDAQMARFMNLKASGEPQFFYDSTASRYTAMFADLAVAQPCVTCHNEHPRSPKTDWVLNDIMGATTWSFPRDSVTLDEARDILRAYRQSARATYERYLTKTASFRSHQVKVVDQWPAPAEWSLPSAQTFCDSIYRASSAEVLQFLLAE
jgi:adenylate cyclase